MEQRSLSGVVKEELWLGRGMLLYGLAGGMDSLVGFLLIPLFARKLTPQSFGILQLVNVYLSLASMVCGLGMTAAYVRAYHVLEGQARAQAMTLAIRSRLLAVCLLTLLLAILIMLPLPSAKIFGNFWSPWLILLWLFSLTSGLLISMCFADLRAQEKAGRYVQMACVGGGINVLLTFGFLLLWNIGIEGILLANVLSGLTVVVMVLWPHRSTLVQRVPWRGKLSKDLLSYALPFVPAHLALWVMDLADRYILNMYHGAEIVGIYSMGYKYASVLGIFLTMWYTAWSPALLRVRREQSRAFYLRFFRDSLASGLAVLVGVAAVLFLLREPVLSLVAPPQYRGAEDVVGPVLLAFLFYAMYYALLGVSMVQGKSLQVSVGTVGGALVNLALNLVWVPHHAAIGAAWATSCGYAALAFGTFFLLVPCKGRSLWQWVIQWGDD